VSIHRDRREAFLRAFGRGVAVFPSAPVALRNNDVEHEYRQDSDLYYLTGLDEPESVLVLGDVHPEHRSVLFVRPRDPARETWDGPRVGVEGAVSRFGVDAAFPIAELAQRLPDYLANADRVAYRFGRDRAFDDRFLDAVGHVRRRARLGVAAPTTFVDPAAVLHEQRLRKSRHEIETMRRAASVTRDAHLAAMRAALPGRHEYEVEAELLRAFRAGGAERPAYGPIVGSGPNATILHYRRNDRRMEEGDLLLIDAGCELDYYACDVTRTFPVSGRFTSAQRAVYEVVLAAQLAAIDAVRPGATLETVHDVAVRELVRGMLSLGLVSGSVDEALEKGTYKHFYMHRTSHWLGMDVHDVGAYFVGGAPRPLEPGFVLTVEPGLYVAETAEAPAELRGLGVRIEDDVLVTPEGCEVLTHDIPKTAAEVERALAQRS
jgi:Xaa-Pro aminopeptidase